MMLAFVAAVPLSAGACDRSNDSGSMPCPPSTNVQSVQDTSVVPTVSSIRDAHLNYTERTKLKNELAAAVERLVERYASDFANVNETPRIEVRGFVDNIAADLIAGSLNHALATRDISTIIRLVERYDIAPAFERNANGTVVFSSSLANSANFRLQQAIEQEDITVVAQILDDESPNLERYGSGHKLQGATPLMHAVSAGYVEISDLLLRAGADPDTRDPGKSISPLFLAVKNNNEALVTLLGRGGVNLDTPIGRNNRMSPVAYSISMDNLDLAALLIELGANPDVTDYTGWTATMDALFAEQTTSIESLIAVTNPLLVTAEPIARGHRTKQLNRRYFPRTNSLYIAWQMKSPRKDDIADALIARARIIEPEWGEAMLRMQAGRSASHAAVFDADIQEAIDRLREALAVKDISAFTPEVYGPMIVLTMECLTELHQLLLINGRDLSATERSQVELIESFGGWRRKLHDMLDAVAAAQTSYPTERLERWRLAYGEPSHAAWDFTHLNNWVESIDDEPMRERLFDTLDFFELNWAVKRGLRGIIR